MKIAILIPTHNRKNELQMTLLSIRNLDLGEHEIHPIIIVDGSQDGTTEMLKEHFSECNIIFGDGNWWYTKCINKGIEKAIEMKLTHVLTLNDDVLFDNNYLLNLISSIQDPNELFIIGSISYTIEQPHRVTFSGVKKIIRWRLKEIPYLKKFSAQNPVDQKDTYESINLSGRGMLFNIDLIRKIGFFDKNLVQYSSDTDFSYRAYKLNIPVSISFDAKIFENHKLTSAGTTFNKPSLKKYYLSYFNKFSSTSLSKSYYYYRKHGNVYLLPFYFLVILIGSFYDFAIKYRF